MRESERTPAGASGQTDAAAPGGGGCQAYAATGSPSSYTAQQ